MRLFTKFLFFLLCFWQYAFAQNSTVTLEQIGFELDGESYGKQFVNTTSSNDKLIEFIREYETFDNWTKLIGFRYKEFPEAGNDPKKVANGYAQTMKTINPGVLIGRVTESEEKNEAVIDFLVTATNGKYVELNIWRFVKSDDGKAIVSVQLAYRHFDGSPEGIKKFNNIRTNLTNTVTNWNMKNVKNILNMMNNSSQMNNITHPSSGTLDLP